MSRTSRRTTAPEGRLFPGVLIAVGVAGAAALLMVWKSSREARARSENAAAIRSVFNTTRESGWIETFETQRTQPLANYDQRWRHIFGNLLVDARLAGAVGDPRGGWQKDGGDDYAFRGTDFPTGSIEIVLDGWYSGEGSLAALGAVELVAPHRFYEAALWRKRLSVIHFRGPTPDQFDVLVESPEIGARPGRYRIVFRMDRIADTWRLTAILQDPSAAYAELARVTTTDKRLGAGAQGIGILSGGGTTHVTGIAVRSVDVAAGGVPTSH